MESPLPSGGNLTREKDLEVIGAEKDLLRIFESSSSGDDDDDGGVSILIEFAIIVLMKYSNRYNDFCVMVLIS